MTPWIQGWNIIGLQSLSLTMVLTFLLDYLSNLSLQIPILLVNRGYIGCVENSCQLMSKDFSNDKTSEHDARGRGSMQEEKYQQCTYQWLDLNMQKDQRLILNPNLIVDS